MNEYRCTRRKPYGPGTIGHTDVTARNGHYIVAKSKREAYVEMIKRYPDDNEYPAFDIQLWKENVQLNTFDKVCEGVN